MGKLRICPYFNNHHLFLNHLNLNGGYMKKFLSLLILSTVLCVPLVSCSDKGKIINNTYENTPNITSTNQYHNDNKNLISISEIKQNIEEDFDSAKKTDYKNLKFREFIPSFPDITSYYNLTLYTNENEISIEETYNNFCDKVKSTVPEHEFDEKNIYFNPKANKDSYKKYSNGYPRVVEYREKLFSGEAETWWYMYESDTEGKTENDFYLWLDPYTLFGVMIKGEGKSITEPGFDGLNFWESDCYETVESYYPIENIPNELHILADGKELSPSSAVSLVEIFFEKYMPENLATSFSTEAVGVEVRTHNNTKGYKVLLANKYKNIPFDYEHNVNFITSSDDRITQNANAFVAISDDVDYFYNLQIWNNVNNRGDEIKSIIPLNMALEITSELLTDNIVFEVLDIKFVYALKGEPTAKVEATGNWKISTYNPNDERRYEVYVNAETGESCYYSTR